MVKKIKNFSWTKNELQIWINDGLIDKALLSADKEKELLEFINKNKDVLTRHSREGFDAQITLPKTRDWHKTLELHVVDIKTGRIIKTLEQITNFELHEGINLHVKTAELDTWKKETAGVKELSKEQVDNLKVFVEKYGKDRPLTREEIVTFIQETKRSQSSKPKTYKTSGHTIDLNTRYPKAGNINLPKLSDATTKKIQDSKVEVQIERIKLTVQGYNIERALKKLLHDKSQHINPSSPDYYLGNEGVDAPTLVPFSGDHLPAPTLNFKRSELYKEYLGRNKYSGAEAELIDKALLDYASQKCLVIFDRIKKVYNEKSKKLETLTDRVEDVISRIKILKFFPNLTEEEKKKLNSGDEEFRKQREEVVILFHPIFIDQIDTKYVEFADDTIGRLRMAAGGSHKVTEAMNIFLDWCARERSSKRSNGEINEDNLVNLLGLQKYAKQGHKRRMRDHINKVIEAMKNMGILLTAIRKANSKGGYKWVFTYNLDYK